MDNTRPVRANTAHRAACMLMTRGYVRILVYTVRFEWNIHTNPVHSSVHRVVATHYGAGGYLKELHVLVCVRVVCSKWYRYTCRLQVTLFTGEKMVVLKLTIGRLKREGFDGSHFRLPTLTLTVLTRYTW